MVCGEVCEVCGEVCVRCAVWCVRCVVHSLTLFEGVDLDVEGM